MAIEVGELKFDKFGVDFPYGLYNEAQAISKKVKSGEKITAEEAEVLGAWVDMNTETLMRQGQDPLQWGWILKSWKKVLEYWKECDIIFLAGGNRASKSFLASRLCAYTGLEIPECEIMCFSEDEQASIRDQQRMFWKALPLSWNGRGIKGLKKQKGSNYSLLYTQKNGFSENKCIIPSTTEATTSGAVVYFQNYKQFSNNARKFEGAKLDIIWSDEKMPFELFKTLLPRLSDKHGKMIFSYTMLDGFTDLVGSILDGAITLETRHSDWLNEDFPVVQKSKNWPRCYTFFLWSEDNPFVDFESLKNKMGGLNLADKKTRAYGIPSKQTTCAFPRFSPSVHVIKDKDMPEPSECTYYQIIDPGTTKPWSMIWWMVDKKGNIYIYRDWPDLQTYGEWALPGGDGQSGSLFRGKAGPAQKASIAGMGYKAYYDLILEKERLGKEQQEPIFMRIIDPRGNKIQQTEEGGTNAIIEMAKLGMFFNKASGPNEITPGMQRITDYFDYNMDEPISEDNHPKLYIHERCQQLISCIMNFTGLGGTTEATKDFIDCIRYGLMTGYTNIQAAALGAGGKKRYGRRY